MDENLNIKMNIQKKVESFWEFIYRMHLYKTKAEGFSKALIITISWVGGVCFTGSNGTISNEIATSVYLFSLALIMEYMVPLVTYEKNAEKVLPFAIVAISTVMLMCTFAILVKHPIKWVEIEMLKQGTIIPQIIIWIDVIVKFWVEPPKPKVVAVGTRLKGL